MGRRTKIGIAAIGVFAAVISLGIAIGSGGVARGEPAPPTTSVPSSQPASTRTVVAAATALPAGTTIQQSQSVATQTADYDHEVALAADGSTYDITVFRKFSASELDGAGLVKTTVPGGTLWVGSDRADQRSLYFLSASGSGVRLANSSTSNDAESLSGLQERATRIAALVSSASAS